MSTRFVVSLAAVVAVVLSARFLLAALPLRPLARPIPVIDLVVAGVGVSGLAFHCGAMFFRDLTMLLPGAGTVVPDIRALGVVSVIWYVAPVALVLYGLRRLHIVALGLVAASLAAVGITMYDGGALQAHLAAIYITVLVLAGVVSALVLPSPRRRAGPGVRPA